MTDFACYWLTLMGRAPGWQPRGSRGSVAKRPHLSLPRQSVAPRIAAAPIAAPRIHSAAIQIAVSL